MTLLSLLSVAMAFALRIGINAYQKTSGKLMENRRVAGAQRILEEELEGILPSVAPCGPHTPPGEQPNRELVRLLSSGALPDAPGVHVFFAAGLARQPADSGAVRYPAGRWPRRAAGGERTAVLRAAGGGPIMYQDGSRPASGFGMPQFLPVNAGPQSFVLADKLAYCRFNYLWQPPKGDPAAPPVWSPTAINNGWPLAVRVEMAPLEADPGTLQPLTVTAALHLHLSPTIPYGDF